MTMFVLNKPCLVTFLVNLCAIKQTLFWDVFKQTFRNNSNINILNRYHNNDYTKHTLFGDITQEKGG